VAGKCYFFISNYVLHGEAVNQCLYRAIVSPGVTEEDSGCELAVFSPLVTLAHVGVECEGGAGRGTAP
jgi:hypothetical protein